MRIFIMLLLLSGFITNSWASVVHLKDGRVVEGIIAQRDSKSLKMTVNGEAMTYYSDEIQDVDGVAFAAAAPTTSTASSSTMNPAKRALILKLMEITGTRANLIQSLDFMKKSMPAQVAVAMDNIINIDELLDALLPIYDRNLSMEDLQGLLNFYESDIGQKFIHVTPIIMKESMQAGQDYVKSKLSQLKNQGAAGN